MAVISLPVSGTHTINLLYFPVLIALLAVLNHFLVSSNEKREQSVSGRPTDLIGMANYARLGDVTQNDGCRVWDTPRSLPVFSTPGCRFKSVIFGILNH